MCGAVRRGQAFRRDGARPPVTESTYPAHSSVLLPKAILARMLRTEAQFAKQLWPSACIDIRTASRSQAPPHSFLYAV